MRLTKAERERFFALTGQQEVPATVEAYNAALDRAKEAWGANAQAIPKEFDENGMDQSGATECALMAAFIDIEKLPQGTF